MSFWHQPETEPTRKYRFRITSPMDGGEGIPKITKPGEETWWMAKSISKPGWEVNTSEYTLINHKFKYPGIVTWGDVSITLVDPGGVAKGLWENLGITYVIPTETEKNKTDMFAKTPVNRNGISQINLQQLNSAGNVLENWTLHDAFVKSVNYGDLSYADDGLVEIQITISYDYATLTN